VTRKSQHPKNRRFQIALSSTEYDTLHKAAESVGCTVASLLRETAMAAAKKILQVTTPAVRKEIRENAK
jgi:uncharacterized protein (DUF1778 family)